MSAGAGGGVGNDGRGGGGGGGVGGGGGAAAVSATTAATLPAVPPPLPQPFNPSLDRLINEEYKIWKKNTPFLYRVVLSKALEWPSLTIQWLPTPPRRATSTPSYTVASLLLGTHTSGDVQNYLMVANARLPTASTPVDGTAFAFAPAGVGSGELGAYGAGENGRVDVAKKVCHDGEVNRARAMPQGTGGVVATKTITAEVLVWDLDRHPAVPPAGDRTARPQVRLAGHTQEGYGVAWSPVARGLLASGADDALVCVWDVAAAASGGGAPVAGAAAAAAGTERGRGGQPPLSTYRGHTGVVEDVAFHPLHPHTVASVGDDRSLRVWDTRSPAAPAPLPGANTTGRARGGGGGGGAGGGRPSGAGSSCGGGGSGGSVGSAGSPRSTASASAPLSPTGSAGSTRNGGRGGGRARPAASVPLTIPDAHKAEVNCVAWAAEGGAGGDLVATGSADATVAVWDLRAPRACVHSFLGHAGEVLAVGWHADAPGILGSASADRRVHVWDCARVGEEQEPDDAEDGPPELLFVHGGHTAKVSDFAWGVGGPDGDAWLAASVAEDNILQVWHLADHIYSGGVVGGRERNGIVEDDMLE